GTSTRSALLLVWAKVSGPDGSAAAGVAGAGLAPAPAVGAAGVAGGAGAAGAAGVAGVAGAAGAAGVADAFTYFTTSALATILVDPSASFTQYLSPCWMTRPSTTDPSFNVRVSARRVL